jgi:hypothetical protein
VAIAIGGVEVGADRCWCTAPGRWTPRAAIRTIRLLSLAGARARHQQHRSDFLINKSFNLSYSGQDL